MNERQDRYVKRKQDSKKQQFSFTKTSTDDLDLCKHTLKIYINVDKSEKLMALDTIRPDKLFIWQSRFLEMPNNNAAVKIYSKH